MKKRVKLGFYTVGSLSIFFFLTAQGCSSAIFTGPAKAKDPASTTPAGGTGTSNPNGPNSGDSNITNGYQEAANGNLPGGSNPNGGNPNGGNPNGGNTPTQAGTPVTPGGNIPDITVTTSLKDKIGSLTTDTFNQTNMQKDLATQKIDNFWVVTRLGNIYDFALEGTTVTSTKQWTVAHHGTGIRTYVTEGGLVFMHNHGHVWFVDPLGTPQGPLDTTVGGANFFTLTNGTDNLAGDANGPRGCPVSYKDANGNRFLAIGYHAGRLAIIPQAGTPPYAPIWAQTNASYQFTVPNPEGWGYSCYIDQSKLVYYGQWTQGATQAINLSNLTQVSAGAIAPNGPEIVETEGKGSYAMSGDRAGNVFNKTGEYTFAKDLTADVVWSTSGTTGNISSTISLWPASCLQNGTNCTPVTYQNAEAIGPMSALSSGGVIGLVRGKPGDDCSVYLMQMKDPTNINSGVNSTKIATVAGDPYMYNDFTGATLYTSNGNVAFNMASNPFFNPVQALSVVVLTWASNPGAPTTWDNLQLDARCYKSGEFPPAFSPVTNMQAAGFRTFLQVGSCRNTAVDTIELRVTDLSGGTSNEARIKSFLVNFFQG